MRSVGPPVMLLGVSSLVMKRLWPQAVSSCLMMERLWPQDPLEGLGTWFVTGRSRALLVLLLTPMLAAKAPLG